MGLEAFRVADLDFMLEDSGVRVKSGLEISFGLLDTDTEPLLGDEGGAVLGKLRTLTIETGSLGTLAIDSTVSIKSPTTGLWTDYVVRDRGEAGEGALEVLLLADY